MIRLPSGLRFPVLSGGVALGVLLLGMGLAGADSRDEVVVGVATAYAFQAAVVGPLLHRFPAKRFMVFGVGMLGRLFVVVMAALVLLSQPGAGAAATLFSMVLVFFATTLLEPLVAGPDSPTER